MTQILTHCIPLKGIMSWFGSIQSWLYGGATAELKGLSTGTDPLRLMAAMSIAAVFGMVHAFMPGHGKTVIVSYYLGRPARLIGSIGTSAILVLAHVGSAIILDILKACPTSWRSLLL